MSLVDLITDQSQMQGRLAKIYGVVVGLVTNNQDPEELGRVKVKFPWLVESDESYWARLAVLMAGPERGTLFIPEVDDEVLVAFEHGDIRFPYVIGRLWNGVDKPPYANSDGNNDIRVIKSRSGHELKFDDNQDAAKLEILTASGHKIILEDESGSEKISIIDQSGNNKVIIDSAAGEISIESENKITLKSREIEIKSDAGAKIESGSSMDIKAGGQLTLKGATVNIN